MLQNCAYKTCRWVINTEKTYVRFIVGRVVVAHNCRGFYSQRNAGFLEGVVFEKILVVFTDGEMYIYALVRFFCDCIIVIVSHSFCLGFGCIRDGCIRLVSV